MPRSSHLPMRFPLGSKYVVEARGLVIARYLEFPDGRRINLPMRKLLPRGCGGNETSVVPEQHDAVSFQRRIFA